MTPRSIRRAQDRKAKKQEARQARNQQLAVAEPAANETSQARLEANRRNAQFSTGPRTEEGKARVSANALKTGLTGQTVLLPSDDVDDYRLLVRRVFDELQPEDDAECELVGRIADTEWRLRRIPCLEEGIYALGQRRFADLFPEEHPTTRAALIQAHAFLTFQKQLNNLSIQENRLRRNEQKDRAELKRLQEARRAAEQQTESTDELGLNFYPSTEAEVEAECERQRQELRDHLGLPNPNAHATNVMLAQTSV